VARWQTHYDLQVINLSLWIMLQRDNPIAGREKKGGNPRTRGEEEMGIQGKTREENLEKGTSEGKEKTGGTWAVGGRTLVKKPKTQTPGHQQRNLEESLRKTWFGKSKRWD